MRKNKTFSYITEATGSNIPDVVVGPGESGKLGITSSSVVSPIKSKRPKADLDEGDKPKKISKKKAANDVSGEPFPVNDSPDDKDLVFLKKDDDNDVVILKKLM